MPTITRLKDVTKRKPKRENQSAKYYNSKQWKSLRLSYLHKNPLCENCLKNDRTTAGECVHHKKFFLSATNEAEIWSLLLSEDNIMTLCNECHIKMHNYAKEHNLKYIDYLKLND